MRLAALALCLLMLGGCITDPIYPIPPTPPPVPPQPIPPEPVPPPPVPAENVSRAIFDGIHVGDPEALLRDLVTPARTVRVGPKTIRAWTLDEARPGGGWVWMEVHAQDGVITALFDF